MRIAIGRATRRSPDRFRIVHYSVQSDHVHLIVEAADERALSAGMRGLVVRIARYVNQLLMRRGALFADRWHGRSLSTPRAVRNALVYVLANFRKHAARPLPAGIDPFSSGPWFDGWRHTAGSARAGPGARFANSTHSAVSPARSWLARSGWRRHGLLDLAEAPRPAPGARGPDVP